MADVDHTNATAAPEKQETPHAERRRFGSPEGVATFLFVGAIASGALLWARPRPFLPDDTPGLWLPAGDVAQSLILEEPPALGEATQQTADRVRAAGAAERDAAAGTLNRDARGLSSEAAAAAERLRATAGDQAVADLRSAMAAEALQALASDAPRSEATDALLGAFEQHLDRYSARIDGRMRAPLIVLQSLFKARWNSVIGNRLMDGLTAVEQQAYWGWLAFEARSAEPPRRLDALDEFEAAGGQPAPEARAVLLYMVGRPVEAAAVLEAAQTESTNLRFRNIALAMVADASEPDTPSPRLDGLSPSP